MGGVCNVLLRAMVTFRTGCPSMHGHYRLWHPTATWPRVVGRETSHLTHPDAMD